MKPTPSTLLLVAALASTLAPGCRKGTSTTDDTASDGPVIIEHCGEIDGDETWVASATHVLSCDVTVTGVLTLQPGVEVLADRETALRIQGGTLSAVGESDGPVLLASNENFPLAGDWVGLVGQDADIQLHWVTVRHAGTEGGLVDLDGGSADVQQLILSNGINQGLKATDTAFSQISGVEVAYVPSPLVLPWSAAQVLSGVYYQEVGSEIISLPGLTVDSAVALPAQEFPYVCNDVAVQGGGSLEVEAGATLLLAGDVSVEDGSFIAYGDQISGASIGSHNEHDFTLSLSADTDTATFRYASISGGSVLSAASDLYFTDNSIEAAGGDALTITGGVKDDDPGNLDENTFTGTGHGLVVPFSVLPSVGPENDCEGSGFDGIVTPGGEVAEDLQLSEWPSEQTLITGDLLLSGGTTSFSGEHRLLFADGTGLTVDGASFAASGISFEHPSGTIGGWIGITVAEGGDDATFEGCAISHGGADKGANLTLAASATVQDCTISSSAGWGILVEGDAEPTIEGVVYKDNALGDLGP